MNATKNIIIICAAICCIVSCKKEADMTIRQKTVLENNSLRQIRVDDGWEVTIVYDSLNSFVALEYSAYLEDHISVKEANQWLSIGFTGKVYPETGSVFKARVHTKEKGFLSINAGNACVVSMEGRFELGEGIDLVLHNASLCNGFEVSAPSCSIDLASESQLFGVQYSGANCAVSVSKSSACKGRFNVEQSFHASVHIQSQLIVFGGSMPLANIEAGNAGTINMAQAEVKEMNVCMAGASEATVNVRETLSGSLLEASTIYYKGSPQINVDCSDDSQVIPF